MFYSSLGPSPCYDCHCGCARLPACPPSFTGSPAAAAYTWDTSVNDNKSFPGAAYAPRARFDRVLTSGPPGLRPVTEHLSLVGTTRVRGGVFPSDHWGVCVDLLLPLPPLSPGGGGR